MIMTNYSGLIVIAVGGTNSAPTVSDSQGNTWTKLGGQTDGSGYGALYYCLNASVSSSQTFTATGTSGDTVFIQVVGFPTGTYSLDKSASAAGGSPGSITPTQTAELVITSCYSSTTGSSVSSPFTKGPGAWIGWVTNSVLSNGLSAAQQAYSPTWSGGTVHQSTVASFICPYTAPIYNTSQLNGLPAVYFNNGPGMLASIPSTNQPITVYAVLKATGGNRYFGAGGSQVRLGSGTTSDMYAGAEISGTAGDIGTSYHIVTGVVNGASSLIRVDQSQHASGSAGTQNPGTSIALGSEGDGQQPGQFYLGELSVYAAAHSLTQMQQQEAYLNGKWFGGSTTTPQMPSGSVRAQVGAVGRAALI
jgi:hypothetical protein